MKGILTYVLYTLMTISIVIGSLIMFIGAAIKALGYLLWFEPKMAREEIGPFIKAFKS